MSQIALPLAWPADPAGDEFLVTASNARAAQAVEHWGAWPVMAMLLTGPRKSGRSLLARIFAAKSGGRILDDAERVPERALFHAWNSAQADRRPLLIVADAAPPKWRIALPDLRSRLAATPHAQIGAPDDELMRALLERQFQRRRLDARADLVVWLATRLDRDHIALLRAVDALEQEVVESRKRLSIPLARIALDAAGLLPQRKDEAA